MNENSDPYFTDETGVDYSNPANRIEEPPACEICGQEEAYVRNYDDGKWYGLSCAAIAGEPSAMMLRAQRTVDDLLKPRAA